MKLALFLLYLYLLIYTLYLFILSIRNLKSSSFSIEKKYALYDQDKDNFAVIIYSHNHKVCLEELVNELKMQDYPLGNFKVYAILDNCNDGSEKIFENDRFVHVLNVQDVGTLGKNRTIMMLLEELKKDSSIDSYIFIDDTRKISSNFLTLANASLKRNDAVSGEISINRESLDVIDKIKAVHKKYIANFFKQARSLMGFATNVDSGLFIVKRDLVDSLKEIDLKDINSELEFSLYLSKIGHKCVYNPNIESYILGQDCTFKRPRLTKRFSLFKSNFKDLKNLNFVFLEHFCSLLNPNCWTLIIAYTLLIAFSYKYQFYVRCSVVVFSALILLLVFALSLINSKLTKKEIVLLMFYPIYSFCHIIKNLPPIRYLFKLIGANTDSESDKLVVDVMVQTKHGDRAAKLEFISTDSGLAKIRFIYKNKKYVTDSHLRMIDALQQLKSKMNDYGLILKICSCCAKFTSVADGSANMLKGACHNDYPSPLITEPRPTLIWNSCSCFEPSSINNLIEEMAREIENQHN